LFANHQHFLTCFFSSRSRHTTSKRDWSSDVCSSDLVFFTGVDLTLDPANFGTFGIPTRSLVPGLAMAGLVTIPGAATLLGFLARSEERRVGKGCRSRV